MTVFLDVAVETWPIAGRFVIARGARTEAVVVVATLRDGDFVGRGECVPYRRYGETVEAVAGKISSLAADIAAGLDRAALQSALPAGAARNALDCAFWDLEAKRGRRTAADLAGLPPLGPVETAFTISMGSAEEMAAAARNASARPLLKIKLGGDGDRDRLSAIRAAVPHARLIVDANEAWTAGNLKENVCACADAGVELIEQPLAEGSDGILSTFDRPVPICADESIHGVADLADLAGRYDAINIKLDKAGGLTGALALAKAAEGGDLAIMVGCMVGTSLAMAPAMLLAQRAAYVDLDGPLLLARDRSPGLVYDGSRVLPPDPAVWG